jgi:acetyl esterase/lipase
MVLDLFIAEAPSLDPVWVAFEKTSRLLDPQPDYSLKERQPMYSRACIERNAKMLAGRDSRLADGIDIKDRQINVDSHAISIRTYRIRSPTLNLKTCPENEDLVIYYHGGGLRVGDLDSEDLSCRRICKDGHTSVISADYRLMGDFPPSAAVEDAYVAFKYIIDNYPCRKLILAGSSSGGQLAAQVSQRALNSKIPLAKPIDGVLLRCPVTVDASENGIHLPARFKSRHTSLAPSFESCLVSIDFDTSREKAPDLPLNAERFGGLPKAFIQLCTNDIYYSDGACYAEALEEAGVEVRVDVARGWPHTFWLKAPELERALEADGEMIRGLKWLLE